MAEASANGEDFVIAITSDRLGAGSDELGETLMKSYLYSLSEADVKPRSLLFLNGGVFLTTKGSAVLESLEALEASGTDILSCGACLNYYRLQDDLKVGDVTNMYEIVSQMNAAQKAIKL